MKVLLLLIGGLSLVASVEAKTVIHRRVMDCKTLTPAQCSDTVLTALGHGPDLKLKAGTATDTVHGAVTIEWCEPMPCEVAIQVDIYEHDDRPKTKGHKSTLKRPVVVPSEIDIKTKLDTMVLP